MFAWHYFRKLSSKKEELHRAGDTTLCINLSVCSLAKSASLAFLGNLREEIVALVIHKNEGREVLYVYLPDSFHTQFGIFKKFYILY